MSLTRRHFLITAASVSTAALGLTGCQGSATPAVGGAETTAVGAEAGAFPVTLAHKFGETTVAQAPLRVVTVGVKEQDDCLAVGVVPVGATKWLAELGAGGLIGEWAAPALGDAPPPEVLDDTDGIQLEKVAALQPDLIIGVYAAMNQSTYDKLSKIAPTIAQPKEYQDWGVPWDIQALTVGRALGRPAKMQTLVDAARQRVRDAAAAHPEFKGLVGLVAAPYEGFFVYGAQDPRPRLLTDLGFVMPKDIEKATKSAWGGQVSTEKVEFFDTDALIWFVDPGQRAELATNNAYAVLKVHREGRAIYSETADRMTAPFSLMTVLSIGYLLDQLVPRLAAAVDGDPATSTDQV